MGTGASVVVTIAAARGTRMNPGVPGCASTTVSRPGPVARTVTGESLARITMRASRSYEGSSTVTSAVSGQASQKSVPSWLSADDGAG